MTRHDSTYPHQQAWSDAWDRFAAGDWKGAEKGWSAILDRAPGDPRAMIGLGMAAVRGGDFAKAIELLTEGLAQRPDDEPGRFHLAMALASAKRAEEAEREVRRLLQARPDDADSWMLLGNVLQDQGRLEEAIEAFRAATTHRPDQFAAYFNLGNALGRLERHREAADAYRRSMELKPDFLQAINNYGNAQQALGEYEESLTTFRRALTLRPDFAEGHLNLGNSLRELSRFTEAERAFAEAARLRPDMKDAWSNRGNVLVCMGRFFEAYGCVQRVLELNPGSADSRKNLGIMLLMAGDLERGWREFEFRWDCGDMKRPDFPQPQWRGESRPKGDGVILLHSEQGAGDVLQFVRYAPLVRQRGYKVIVHAYRPLVTLLRTCPGIDAIAAWNSTPPPFDVQAPLMSLPGLLGTTLANVPAKVPYLHAEPNRVAAWRSELASWPGFRIGIVWQGNPKHLRDRHRSIPLAAFEPLARVPGVRLISLQKNDGVEQLREVSDRFEVIDLGPQLDNDPQGQMFLDTAAIMKSLDLVVACDTSTAHLAGALGVPIWLALSLFSDWRWMRERDDTPWYPTMRIFRQRTPGDWFELFESMANLLRQRLGRRETMPRVDVPQGELIDKIVILRIKERQAREPQALGNVRRELAALEATRARTLSPSTELDRLTEQLANVNQQLWDVEDELRVLEQSQDFGPRFIELARSVYQTNDRRAALKREINQHCGARFMEEKMFTTDRGARGEPQVK